MKHHIHSLTSLSLVVLSHFYTFTEATCNKYIPARDISKDLGWYAPIERGPTVQVSKAMTCAEGKPDKYYTCGLHRFTKTRACWMPPRGSIASKGTTNVTLSDHEAEHLFDLVNDQLPKHLAGYHDIYYNLEGCVFRNTHIEPFSCLREGESGYMEGAPQLYCTEGTVGGCSGEGSLTEGMAVKVCGSKSNPQLFGPGHRRNHVPTYVYTIKHLNASEVEDYQEYPGNSSRGKNIFDGIKNSVSTNLPTSLTVLLGAAVATFLGYELIF